MLIGDPYKFSFIIERIPEWEDTSFINGWMFLKINDELYPKEVRTTTLNCELPDLLGENSPMKKPVVDKELYRLDSRELFDRIARITYSEELDALYDISYQLPFHEINDEGWDVFIISDGENIKLLVGEWKHNKLADGSWAWAEEPIFHDETELSCDEYKAVIDGLEDFYNSLKNERRS